MRAAAAHPVPLEIDPESNERGGRMREIAGLLRALTGAESALVVNNCASAVLLVLAAVASGKDVVVSRGEAVEIGGGFRVPDVLRQSGARLVEVGTTNRTYARDYAAATTEETGAYLKVHPSNFRAFGFVHSASTAELVVLAREHGLPVLEDLGSGALLDTSRFGLAPEPTLTGAIAAGADLVMASADKLLGGPQGGIIVGSAPWVERVARHPLARAVRADKTALAGIATTLRHYLRGEAESRVPIWRMIAEPESEIRVRATHLAAALEQDGLAADVEPVHATVGGGSLPARRFPAGPSCFLPLSERESIRLPAVSGWETRASSGASTETGSCSTCGRSYPRKTRSCSALCGIRWARRSRELPSRRRLRPVTVPSIAKVGLGGG